MIQIQCTVVGPLVDSAKTEYGENKNKIKYVGFWLGRLIEIRKSNVSHARPNK